LSYSRDRSYFTSLLELPSGYAHAVSKLIDPLSHVLSKQLSIYNEAKASLDRENPGPSLNEAKQIRASKFQIQNVSSYLQASNFAALADAAIPQTKPLLLYYAENSLFAFFINSVFRYPGYSSGHGMKVNLMKEILLTLM
jgi:hypothetical protein